MMTFAIYYRAADGEIMGWTNSFEPIAPDGMSLIEFDEPLDPPPDPMREKIAGGSVVLKTAAEVRAARMPTLRDVAVAVFVELSRTDSRMLPDYPMSGGERHAWTAYRAMLRNLTGDAEHRINAWALPPDGVDPITDLRERLRP
jgi:hypothetical protein